MEELHIYVLFRATECFKALYYPSTHSHAFQVISSFRHFLTNLIRVSLFLYKYQIRLETKKKAKTDGIQPLFGSSISFWLLARPSVPQLQRVAVFILYRLKIEIRKRHDTGCWTTTNGRIPTEPGYEMQVTLIMSSNHQTVRRLITRVGNFGSLRKQ